MYQANDLLSKCTELLRNMGQRIQFEYKEFLLQTNDKRERLQHFDNLSIFGNIRSCNDKRHSLYQTTLTHLLS